VPFLVQADKDADDDGIIGLPVMLALETVRWGSDGMMDIGFPAGSLDVREANLAFAGDKILTAVGFGQRQLDLHLDTGSADTRLYPRFRYEHAAFLSSQKQTWTDSSGVLLPEMHLLIGHSERTLSPAHLMRENPEPNAARLHGSLGIDFITQASTVTLDFRAMQMTLAGVQLIRQDAGEDVTCRLHGPVDCPKGWRCQVRPAGEVCDLDRVPEKPWPGNALPASSEEARVEPRIEVPGDVDISPGVSPTTLTKTALPFRYRSDAITARMSAIFALRCGDATAWLCGLFFALAWPNRWLRFHPRAGDQA
jgi:hypothetical protein